MFQALRCAKATSNKFAKRRPLPIQCISNRFRCSKCTTESISPEELRTLVTSQYKRGKFRDLLNKVISSPPLLLSASQNIAVPSNGATYASVSKRFSIEQMSQELSSNLFPLESHCVRLRSAIGETLTLPDLKLKVLIESLRMVLEAIYERKFLTFSYGGRVGMGRHTAIRYLENSVENPTWWFTVSFPRRKFDSLNVQKLCCLLNEKIEDSHLLELIKNLFKCGVLEIELGGLSLARGLPQECGLCSILINIYFHKFDQELQQLRFETKKEHPRNPKNGEQEHSPNVYKPVRVYAVRYLDEILVVSSESRSLVKFLRKFVLEYLQEELFFTVNESLSHFHSATLEKITFLGMELQAVPPSVLRPPPSEKAIRARKKYARQKEVKAKELQNAIDKRKRRLGMKIFSHVFKKSKTSNGIKFDFQIENEVKEIFSQWAHETAHNFISRIEERFLWHQMLTTGDFFSLGHIREQLPEQLVAAYDNFQEQAHKHLSPVKHLREAEERERKEIEEEEREYEERTMKDLTTLCLKVLAPIEMVQKAVKRLGFTNHMGRPRPIAMLLPLKDSDIVKYYSGIGNRWLGFYCCCHNYRRIKTIVTYHLRFSCILTLAAKHEISKRDVMKRYTKDLVTRGDDGVEEAWFPPEGEVRRRGDDELADPTAVDGNLCVALIRMAVDPPVEACAGHFCERSDVVLYRVNLVNLEGDWMEGMGVVHEAFHRKCVCLCGEHATGLYMGAITLAHIDFSSLVELP